MPKQPTRRTKIVRLLLSFFLFSIVLEALEAVAGSVQTLDACDGARSETGHRRCQGPAASHLGPPPPPPPRASRAAPQSSSPRPRPFGRGRRGWEALMASTPAPASDGMASVRGTTETRAAASSLSCGRGPQTEVVAAPPEVVPVGRCASRAHPPASRASPPLSSSTVQRCGGGPLRGPSRPTTARVWPTSGVVAPATSGGARVAVCAISHCQRWCLPAVHTRHE